MSDVTIHGGVHAGRDAIIRVGDTQPYKRIEEMTPRELHVERASRNKLIVQAAEKNKQQLLFCLKVLAVTLSILVGWAKLVNEVNLAMGYFGALFVGLPALVVWGLIFGDDPFIARQEDTIKHIDLLLREREPFE